MRHLYRTSPDLVADRRTWTGSVLDSETFLFRKFIHVNSHTPRLTLSACALALLTAMLWGGLSVSIKVALGGLPPFLLAAARFLLGLITVFIWVFFSRIPLRLAPGERRGLLLLIPLFVGQIYVLNLGTHLTLASRATIFTCSYPLFTALLAHFTLDGDRLSVSKGVGMALSFGGVLLVFAESLALHELSYIPGDLLSLGSGFLLGARHVYAKHLLKDIHPGKLLFWQATLSVPCFLLLSAAFEQQVHYAFTPEIGVAILYQGMVVAGFCFIVMTSLLRKYRASQLGTFGFATPVFGVLLSNILLAEPISAGLLASMLLVGAGIAIVNRES